MQRSCTCSSRSPTPARVKNLDLIFFLPMHIQMEGVQGGGRLEDWVAALQQRSLQQQGKELANPWVELSDPLEWSPTPDETPTAQNWMYSEFVYFHAFAQRFLYSRGARFRVFRRSLQFKCLDVLLTQGMQLRLDAIFADLVLFDIGLAILALRVRLLHDNLDLPLSTAQTLLDYVRRVYPPFWSGDRQPGLYPQSIRWNDSKNGLGEEGPPLSPLPFGNDVPHGVGSNAPDNAADCYTFVNDYRLPPTARHWQELLWPLIPRTANATLGQGRIMYRHIQDERMPLMAFIEIDDAEALTRPDMVRLAFCDKAGDSNTYPYGRRFLADFEKLHCYDRFWDGEWRLPVDGADESARCVGEEADSGSSPGRYCFRRGRNEFRTRYLCTGYAFIMLVEKPPDYLREHFHRHYFKLGLLVHLHRAGLLVFLDRLSAIVQEPAGSEEHSAVRLEPLQKLKRDFLDFIDLQSFSEVSNHVQARELFDWWSERLGTKRLFEEVQNEIALAAESVQLAEQEKQSRATLGLTVAATFGLVWSLLFAGLQNWLNAHPTPPGHFVFWWFTSVSIVVGLILLRLSLEELELWSPFVRFLCRLMRRADIGGLFRKHEP